MNESDQTNYSKILPTNLSEKSLIISSDEITLNYKLSFAYVLISLLSSSFLYNWPAAQELLVHSRAYEWTCKSANKSLEIVTCDLQSKSISVLLLPIGLASSFFFSLFSGISLDIIGPKCTALMGLFLQAIGWFILLLANINYHRVSYRMLTYTLAIILLGFGNQPITFSLINSANLFPKSKFLLTGFIVSASALGLVIPVILNQLLKDQSITIVNVCISYCLLQIILMLASGYLLPFQKISGNLINEKSLPINVSDMTATSRDEMYEHRSFMSLPTTVDSTSKKPNYKVADGMRESRAISKYIPNGKQSYVSDLYQKHNENDFYDKVNYHKLDYRFYDKINKMNEYGVTNAKNHEKENIFPIPDKKKNTTSGSSDINKLGCLKYNEEQEEDIESCTSSAITQSKYWRGCSAFWIIEQPALYFSLFPLASVMILCVTFTGNSILSLNPAISPSHVYYLSCLPSIASSFLLQSLSPTVMLILVNTVAWFYFLITQILPYLPILYYLAVLLGSFFTSFFMAPFYCFIAKHFPERYFGSLLGLIIMFSGIFSVIATPMCDILSYKDNYQPMNVFCLGLLSANYLILSYLYRKIDCYPQIPIR